MIALGKKARSLAVAQTALAAGLWLGAQAHQLLGDTQRPVKRNQILSLPNALSPASNWILDSGDLSISRGVCTNREGQDSKIHLVTSLPDACELAFRVNWILGTGATDPTSACIIHFGAARASDDLGDSGYAVVLMRNASLALVRANQGHPEVLDLSIIGAWNFNPIVVKIVRAENAIRVFVDGTLKISRVDSAHRDGGYLSLRTTRFPDLSGGRDVWRIENLSIKGYRR